MWMPAKLPRDSALTLLSLSCYFSASPCCPFPCSHTQTIWTHIRARTCLQCGWWWCSRKIYRFMTYALVCVRACLCVCERSGHSGELNDRTRPWLEVTNPWYTHTHTYTSSNTHTHKRAHVCTHVNAYISEHMCALPLCWAPRFVVVFFLSSTLHCWTYTHYNSPYRSFIAERASIDMRQ